MAKNYWNGMPASLRIGAHDLAVLIIPGWSPDSEDGKTQGQYSSNEQNIRFGENAPSKTHAVDTAFHEICHALLLPLGIKEKKEEPICSLLGSGLAQVLRDNPQFVTWLRETETNDNGNAGNRSCGPDCKCARSKQPK